jgi:hypothetical protein
MRFWSTGLTDTSLRNSRLDRLLFLRRKWVARAFLLVSLPRPVILNLFDVVLWVFILGTVSSVTPSLSYCVLRSQALLAPRTPAPVGRPAPLLPPGLANRSVFRHAALLALGHKPPFPAYRLKNPGPGHGLAPSLQELFLRLTCSETNGQVEHLPSSIHSYSSADSSGQGNSAHPARHPCRAEQPSPQRT